MFRKVEARLGRLRFGIQGMFGRDRNGQDRVCCVSAWIGAVRILRNALLWSGEFWHCKVLYGELR